MSNFVNLLDAPYSRHGSFIAFANDNYGEDLYGELKLAELLRRLCKIDGLRWIRVLRR